MVLRGSRQLVNSDTKLIMVYFVQCLFKAELFLKREKILTANEREKGTKKKSLSL